MLLKDSGAIPPEWLPAVDEGAELLKLLRAEADAKLTVIRSFIKENSAHVTLSGSHLAKRGLFRAS